METIPIIGPKPEIQVQIEKYAKEIIEIKKVDQTANTLNLEAEINQLVYELYGLSEEEIKIVEREKKGE